MECGRRNTLGLQGMPKGQVGVAPDCFSSAVLDGVPLPHCTAAAAAVPCRDHPDVQMRFQYSEALAHLIYAAADVLLVPSMFEPCGLTQVGGRAALLRRRHAVLLGCMRVCVCVWWASCCLQ